jgi:amino acid adenylation domain-containing protein
METMTLQGFRLSPQQRRAWRMQQESAVCAAQSLVRLDGDLDASALAAALDKVVRRHEILRTGFRPVPGLKVPVQVVAEPARPVLDRVDLTRAEVDRLVELDRRRPFDLAEGRPLRASLIRLGAESHLLLLSVSPLCADSATLRNLVREIAQAHAGEPGPDSMQYADFSEWQNDWLESEEAEEGKDFWLRQGFSELESAGLSPVFDCAAVGFDLDPGDLQAAEGLARRHEAPLAAVFLAAWQSLLARLDGRSEIVVGAICSGRSYAEIADAPGLFARTLPLRAEVAGLRFHELVQRAGTALGEAEAWQDYFVADEVLPAGADYAFEFEELPDELAAGGLRLTIERQFHCTERFRLRLVCSRTGAELQYDPQLFGREAMAGLAGQWRRLLSALLADPGREPADVDLLDEAERRLLLEEWNRTAALFPAGTGIHQLVETRAAAHPDAPALLSGERVVTYGQLDRRADRLARALVDLGVRPGSIVALWADRSPETVAGLLAVLKAGGTYVALDPEQPRARLAHVLEETAPSVLLASRPLAAKLPEHPARVVWLDDEPAPSDAALPAADPRRLAYVVFTSGSTGRPKGVLIRHEGVVNYLTFLQTAYGLGESDVVLQIPDLTFDSSVRDLLGPLAAGARVVLVERGLAKDPRHLLHQVRERGVTCLLSAVPTMLRALLDEAAGAPAPLASVRLVLASGEVLRADDGARVERVFGTGARLYNQYGPTECTMTSSFHPVPRGLSEGDGTPLPVGRPISNARFYLLDERRLPVPVGRPGELYIGGVGVADGYLNAPGLTAERFVEDPFAPVPGSRLYRTGDLAVYRPDGVLEFRGRIDQQIKLRGVRIELEEIEATLLELPAVQRAVVVAREDAPGDVRLAAYLVFRSAPVSGDELRLFLRGRLPELMIPSAFVVLESLPMTPNGKVDRRSLPAPDPVETSREALRRTARTPTEEIVAGIWAEVLKTGEVDPRDDFFSLGGHSLLGTQVILRINETFQVSIPLRALFDVPTVEGLARLVDEAVLAEQGVKAPPLRPARRDGALPLSFAQQRLWFLDQLHPGNPLFNLGSALRLLGPLDLGVLQRTLDEIVRRHETLRTTFAGAERGPVQVIAPPVPMPLAVEDLSDRDPAERQAGTGRLIAAEARRPFDLARGPLVRALVVRQGEEEHVLFLGLHHIISDAWSSGVLFRELAALFEAFSRGGSSPLPELPVQYADFAVWQREWLQGEVLEAQLDFWKRQLDAAPAVLALPFDRPRPESATFQGGRHGLELHEDLTRGLAALTRREGATTFMTLLAAFSVTLRFLGAGDDVVVGADVANRTRAETEGLIGFFINQLVLRNDLSGDPTFAGLLARVRKTAMDAYAHQDLPFDKLVEVLRPGRSLNHAPLFQVKLVLQNTPRSTVELPSGLTVERMPLESTPAREDLLLNINETARGLSVTFKYNADLFEARTIARAAGLFETVLRRVASEPGITLSELDRALADTERESRANQAQEHASALEQKLKTIRRRATNR